MNNQYINYNLVRVIICDDYTITNVQTKGLPGENCGCHLESLTIDSEVVGSGNPNGIGAKGTINVVDYKDSVIHKLIHKLKTFLKHNKDENFLPTVQIDIECFTGKQTYRGHIKTWQLDFVGTTPSVIMTWESIVFNPEEVISMPYNTHWKDPVKLINKLSQAYNPHTPIVGPDGKEIKSGSLVFINPEGVDMNLASLPSCGNREIDAYFFIAQNSKFDGKLVTGEYDKENKKFKLVYRQAKENDIKTEEGEVSNKLIFVQNGSYTPYKARDVDGKIVIPMTSFNYTLDMNKLSTSHRVFENPNGTMVARIYGTKPDSLNQPQADSNQKDGTTADASSSSAIEVSFECYNVMAFSKNNLNEPIEYEIYNEFGQKHITTGKGTVKSLTYSINGSSVVRASITCTEAFSEATTDVKSGAQINQENESGTGNTNTDSTTQEAASNAIKEDENPLPLNIDKTELCLSNGIFAEHVAEFIDKYGDLKGTDRLLSYNFVYKLISAGNYGLLTLLIAVANYGVKDAPPEWKTDPVNSHEEFVNRSSFCASGDGKTPYDHKKGGIGIAHFDDDNLRTIYTTCGFDPNLSSDNKSKLQKLFTYPKEDSGKCTGWRSGTFKGMTRIFPEFEKKPKPAMRDFDNGLKQDDIWLSWAKEMLNYNRDGSDRPYQQFLFELWIKEYWTPVKKKVAVGSRPQLQDVIRISRIGNSYGGLKRTLPGEPVSTQFRQYIEQRPAKKVRYTKQFLFCQRACKIAEYEYAMSLI